MIANKKARLNNFVIVLLVIVLTSSAILANDLDTLPILESGSILEKIAEIEVWANTYLNLKIINNNLKTLLTLDNGSILPEQEIEFYLNESLVSISMTDLEGYAPFPNLNENVPGNYFLKTIFRGDPSLFLNPSSAEKTIEILDENGSVVVRFADGTGIKLPEIVIPENLTGNLTENVIGNMTGMNETNTTIPKANTTLFTLFTVYTDKKTYFLNETINIFGEAIINSSRINSDAVLEIIFNGSTILQFDIGITNGSYSSSLLAKFANKGSYLAKVTAKGLSAETSFNLILNASKPVNIEGISCEEFKEQILWSSGYSNNEEGSTTYQTWTPKHGCSELNVSGCFLGNVEIKTRFLYFGENNQQGEGFIQISDPDESICGAPEQGNYSKYLAYESFHGESQKLEQHCGDNKNPTGRCAIDLTDGFDNTVGCYGIKSSADKHFIVDAFEVKYTLCSKN